MSTENYAADDLERLLELAHHPDSDATLSPDEATRVRDLRRTLSILDGAWQFVDAGAKEQLRAKTLGKLATLAPEHLWGRVDQVQTLGDLIRAVDEELAPMVAERALDCLRGDATPVAELLRDGDSRRATLRSSFERAAVPDDAISGLFTRVLRALSNLVSASEAGGFVYARPQRMQRKPTRNASPRPPR